MKTMRETLDDIKSGSTSARKITNMNKGLKTMQSRSSNKFKGFTIDLNNPTNEMFNDIDSMINEWEFKIKDEYGIINKNFFEDGKGRCEFCGKVGCKSLYRIVNHKTNKSMEIASQCIKLYQIPTYIDGEPISIEEGFDYINKLNDISKSEYGKLFTICNQNNLIILNNNPKYKEEYLNYLKDYGRIIYSVIDKTEREGKIPDKEELNEVFDAHHSFYIFSKDMNNEGLVTFVPGAAAVLNNTFKYSAKFKVILNNLLAEYCRNNTEDKKFNFYNAAKKAFDITKDFNCFDIYSIASVRFWTKERFVKESNRPNIFDLVGLIVLMPNNKKEATDVFKMYKFPQEVLGKTTLKEYVSKYVESLYKNIIKKDDLNEFDKFIIMIHDEVIGTIMPSFLKDRDDRIENKNNKPKKNIRHKSRNNLV